MKISEVTIAKGCDICGGTFHKSVYDARTKEGPWAWMCHDCFVECGIKLGTGFG